MYLSKYGKNSLLIDLSKFLKIMHYYVFFLGIMCSELNYTILHPCITPEALTIYTF